MCVERGRNLCYGMSGCPLLLSYAHTSDLQRFYISRRDVATNWSMIVEAGNIHSAHEVGGGAVDSDLYLHSERLRLAMSLLIALQEVSIA